MVILRTTAELEALAPEWRELWHRSPAAKPFQRPEWLLPWWHQFGQPELYAVCLRDQGRLEGFLPLYVYADAERGERQLLLVGAGTSDYLDGLFSPACTAKDVRAIVLRLADEATWDVAHLTQLSAGSLLYTVLSQLGSAGDRAYSGESCSRCPAVAIAELPKKVRADVRYFRNAAIGLGKLALEVADAGSCGSFLEILVRLHTASWQERGQAGVLADAAVLAWHRKAVPLLEAAGCLRLYVLTLDGEPVAALYALVDSPDALERTAYFYLMGYAPEHAEFKPGILLTAMATEHAHAEGVQVIDMLRGEESYKKFWHVDEVPTYGFSLHRLALLECDS